MLKNLGRVGLSYGRNGERSFINRGGQQDNQTSASIKVTASSMAPPTNGQRGGPSTVSAIRGNYELPLLTGFVNDTNLPTIRAICRDMYKYDAIAGGVVDLISTLPWSEVILTGLKDSRATDKYAASVEAMNIKSAFPEITIEHLVNGAFVADVIFDENRKVFTGMAPQDIEQCVINPVPIYGRDPLISVNIPESYKQLLKLAGQDKRAAAIVKEMGDDFMKSVNKGFIELDPENTLYVPRRTFATQITGTPFLQRIIPLFLMEKALMRGTIESAYRRQKPVTHIMAGDEEWIPDNVQLNSLAQHFLQADQDPTSAIIATRPSIMVTEILSPTGFWRWDESSQTLTDHKLKGLGVSDAFLSGDVNLNTMDTALSVFIERVAYLRWTLTNRIFYNKLFPKIAEANGFKAVGSMQNRIQGEVSAEDAAMAEYRNRLIKAQYGDDAVFVGNGTHADSFNPSEWMMPKVQYLKQLKPEADSAYMDILDKLKEQGIPVPLRAYAAAGGLSINEIVSQSEDDIKLRNIFKEIIEKHPKSADAEASNMFGDNANEEEAAIRTLANAVQRKIKLGQSARNRRIGLQNRNYGDAALLKDDKSGKILSRKGQDIQTNKLHKTISEALTRIAYRENAVIKSNSMTRPKLFASYDKKTKIPKPK